ncbi:MAG: hypothetical protein ACRC9V_07755 [Aeromonas sp.]
MIAVKDTHTVPTMRAASKLLVSLGYQKVGDCWIKDDRYAAVVIKSPTGRVIIKEGVGV